jgi:hypothetical protein
MAESFVDFIARERDRLHGEREAVFARQQELQTQLDAINQELAAIDAYEAAKSGKSAQRRRASVHTTRRSSKRDALIQVIREHPGGLSRGDILDRMGLKGDKSGEMSVSNALTALTKSNQVQRRNGKYLTTNP